MVAFNLYDGWWAAIDVIPGRLGSVHAGGESSLRLLRITIILARIAAL